MWGVSGSWLECTGNFVRSFWLTSSFVQGRLHLCFIIHCFRRLSLSPPLGESPFILVCYDFIHLQEHTILFITGLLSPSVPADYSGNDSHLIDCAPFLNVLLVGISTVDCVQIFSLHGLVGCSLKLPSNLDMYMKMRNVYQLGEPYSSCYWW